VFFEELHSKFTSDSIELTTSPELQFSLFIGDIRVGVDGGCGPLSEQAYRKEKQHK
jgi:hypothetical protein